MQKPDGPLELMDLPTSMCRTLSHGSQNLCSKEGGLNHRHNLPFGVVMSENAATESLLTVG
jgi:hypothetical protein